MTDRTYKVALTAGAHAWTVTDLDPPGYGLMDPLTIGWSLPDGQHRPAQPDTMVASFSVVVASAADLDDLILGDLVRIAVTFGPVDKPAADVVFYGRIAQGEATAHARGMLYRFTCADLTTDLAGFDIGADPYAVEAVFTRMVNLLTRAGVPNSSVNRDQVVAAVDTALTVEAIDQPSASALLDAVIALWDQVALAGLAELAGVNYRAIIAPYPGPFGMEAQWALDSVPDAYVPSAAAPLPAVFGHWFPDPDGWGLAIDPDDRTAGVIDACYVDFESDWAAIQPSVVNRAAVLWLVATDAASARHQAVTYTMENPPPAGQSPTTTTRDTQTLALTSVPAVDTAARVNADRLGHMMIPAPQNPGAWGPDAFRWLLYKDQTGLQTFPVIFPRHDATGAPTPRILRTACYVRPIVITPIPGRWNPPDAGRDWVGGQLSNVVLTISDGRPVVDFELTPTLPDQGNPSTGVNSWNAGVGTWDAQVGVWDDLEPGRVAFRWDDSALAGITWNQVHPQPWNMYRLARGN